MDQEEALTALAEGILAHDIIVEHAAKFESDWATRCLPCNRYVAAMIRGAKQEEAVKLACMLLRDAVDSITKAREAAKWWLGQG